MKGKVSRFAAMLLAAVVAVTGLGTAKKVEAAGSLSSQSGQAPLPQSREARLRRRPGWSREVK